MFLGVHENAVDHEHSVPIFQTPAVRGTLLHHGTDQVALHILLNPQEEAKTPAFLLAQLAKSWLRWHHHRLRFW